MKTIWKFPLPKDGKVRMPAGSKIVHFSEQGGAPTIWALVDPEVARDVDRTFQIFGSNIFVPDDAQHVWTWISGPLAWHLFEVTQK